MKRFIEGADRSQSTLLPECLDDWVDENNSVRAVDRRTALKGAEMCNLYSMTANRSAIINLFKVGDNRAAKCEAASSIFPAGDAPVVRQAGDGERELSMLSWGFVLNMKDRAPKRVTNFRDDNIDSQFWNVSFRDRRCLVPVTSFSEPKGKKPAIWHWFALSEKREPFAFAGIWRSYSGAVKKDGPNVDIDTYSFMTTKPNELVAEVHPNRMPVMLVGEADQEQWLTGTEDDARELVRTYPAEKMAMVQASENRYDKGK